MVPDPLVTEAREGEIESRASTYFRTFAAMRYQAVNIGAHEMVVGPRVLKRLAKRHGIAVLSANIVDDKTDKPVFRESLVKTIGGLKIGMLGLITESPQNYGKLFLEQGMRVQSPIDSAKRVVRSLRTQGCDLIVVLSQLKRLEVEDLDAKVRGIHLVLGSTAMEFTLQMQTLERVFFADTYTKGKYVGEVLFHLRKQRGSYVIENLRQSLEGERTMVAQQIQSYQAQLESAEQPDSGLHLSEESTQVMRRQLAKAKAKLQRLTMSLEGKLEQSPDKSTLKLTMHGLDSDIEDDAKVLAVVEGHKKKFPKPGK
jgi:2',3'-cyclic-nucleotide 2'-phosphodiesterase (5'-nucleotidase family)